MSKQAMYYTDSQYFDYVRGALEASLKALLKTKPYRRPPGVESTLRRLLNDTDERIADLDHFARESLS